MSRKTRKKNQKFEKQKRFRSWIQFGDISNANGEVSQFKKISLFIKSPFQISFMGLKIFFDFHFIFCLLRNQPNRTPILSGGLAQNYAIFNKSDVLFHFCLGLGYVDRIQVRKELKFWFSAWNGTFRNFRNSRTATAFCECEKAEKLAGASEASAGNQFFSTFTHSKTRRPFYGDDW